MTIFTHPQWCIEPLRPHGRGAVSLAPRGGAEAEPDRHGHQPRIRQSVFGLMNAVRSR